MHLPFDLSLAAQTRHAQLGCRARLTEVYYKLLPWQGSLLYGRIFSLSLVETVLREAFRYRVSGSGYPGPASCRRGHCCIKMVDGTDNQKKVEDTENKTALCSTRYI